MLHLKAAVSLAAVVCFITLAFAGSNPPEARLPEEGTEKVVHDVYFTLKDAGAQLNCVLWRSTVLRDRELLGDGQRVVVQGEQTVYEPRGQYQLVVRSLELQGLGALQAAFERLKQKLNAAGWFAAERKRSMPKFPRRVGIVTSPTGAAIRDVEKRIAFSTAKEPERNAAGNDQQHRRRATRFHWHKRSHKPGKTISVARKRLCPRHHAQRLRPTNEVASQSVIDLTFTRNGVRKTIIKYEGKKAFCPRCRASYWPPAVTQVRGHVFGRSFQAWAVYQRVALRLPYTAISHVMDGLFSEHVSTASLTYFLRRFADEYEVSEKRLLQRILESPFVHVDETELNVRGRNQ